MVVNKAKCKKSLKISYIQTCLYTLKICQSYKAMFKLVFTICEELFVSVATISSSLPPRRFEISKRHFTEWIQVV